MTPTIKTIKIIVYAYEIFKSTFESCKVEGFNIEVTNKFGNNFDWLITPIQSGGYRIKAWGTPEDFDIWAQSDDLVMRAKHFLSEVLNIHLYNFHKYLLDVTMDTSEDLVWHKSIDGTHLTVNKAFQRLVGKTKDDIVGKDHYDVWDVPRPANGEDVCDCVTSEAIVRAKGEYCVFEEEVQVGKSVHNFVTGKSPVYNLDGDFIATIGYGRDVTLETMHKAALKRLAVTDELTGLYNRTYVQHFTDADDNATAVMFIDIDKFKQINDLLGHDRGDDALRCIARGLQSLCPDDILVRGGGDEFLIIFSKEIDANAIRELEYYIKDRLDAALDKEVPELRNTVSIGTVVNIERDSFTNLLYKADKQMYTHKKETR